jgi:hypothetical protein
MRLLFLASYFPKPANPLMGTWALAQARALARQPIELRTVSLTSWVPGVALGEKARAFSQCPATFDWGGIRVEYPRWPFYQFGRTRALSHRDPDLYLGLAWPFARR